MAVKKKKKVDYTIWLLGAAAVGLLGFVFKDDIKKLFIKSEPEPDLEPIPGPIPTPIITGGGGSPAATTTTTPGLSPLGTPKDNLNMDKALKIGDRGQEVAKLQQILNRIAQITGKAKVKEDGIFGDGTRSRLSQMFGNISNINLYKMYVALFAIYAADKGKNAKNWFSTYQTFLMSDALRNAARTEYFKNNTIL
jgi:hypothetical protein